MSMIQMSSDGEVVLLNNLSRQSSPASSHNFPADIPALRNTIGPKRPQKFVSPLQSQTLAEFNRIQYQYTTFRPKLSTNEARRVFQRSLQKKSSRIFSEQTDRN